MHRIGRTARAGKEGVAITFYDPAEVALMQDIERLISVSLLPEGVKGVPSGKSPKRTKFQKAKSGQSPRRPSSHRARQKGDKEQGRGPNSRSPNARPANERSRGRRPKNSRSK